MEYVLYGHGGAYNHGAEAIVKITIGGILARDKGGIVSLSSHFPEQDKAFQIVPKQFLTHNMEFLKREKEERLLGYPTGRYDREIYKSTIDALNANTIALSVGGDNYCYPVWHRWKCIHDEAVLRGAKDILWSCSINPDGIDAEMKKTLESHSLITTRESLTYEALLEKGLKNVVLCADVAFLLEPKELELPEGFVKGNTIAINVSPLVMRREKSAGIVKSAIIELMDYILVKTDMNIALVPHVVMPMDNDYVALSELYNHYDGTKWQHRICLFDGKLSAAEYKYIISQCRFGVFARTHGSIAAYSSGVPTLVLGYSIKAQGIARDMGVSEYVIDIENLIDSKQLYLKFGELRQNEERIKEITKAGACKMKILAAGMFDYLSNI